MPDSFEHRKIIRKKGSENRAWSFVLIRDLNFQIQQERTVAGTRSEGRREGQAVPVPLSLSF